jgi:transcriptional regulator with XRE-family HTH domain
MSERAYKWKGKTMKINYKLIGKQIKEFRLAKNLTQEQLAELCDISNIHISNIERGSGSISLATLEKLARELDFEINVNIYSKENDVAKISAILEGCQTYEYKVLYDVLIATKNSLYLNSQFKF